MRRFNLFINLNSDMKVHELRSFIILYNTNKCQAFQEIVENNQHFFKNNKYNNRKVKQIFIENEHASIFLSKM